jgi:hypothetical protein
MPSYPELDTALARAGAEVSAAEGHGLLCALLCVGADDAAQRWLDEVVPAPGPGAAVVADLRRVLDRVWRQTDTELAGPDSDLQLLLPDDEVGLAERTAALADWCGAFLYGLGTAGLDAGTALSAEARETLADLSEVSRLAPEAGGEDDERAFFEVSEFVRVAVMFLFEELNAGNPAGQPERAH